MQYFRKLIDHKKLSALLLFGLMFRSLIAAGFMLDTMPSDGSLFTVTVCDGPAGINVIAGLSEKTQHHEHHSHQSKPSNTDTEHNHAVTEDHGFSACSFWSASAQSLTISHKLFEAPPIQLNNELIFYQSQFFHSYSKNSQFARAPPVLLI